jgi:hypothetical protein
VTEPQPPNLGGNPEIRTYSKIAAAIADVQRELPVVGKDQTAKVTSDKGSYSYSYADLTAVSRAIYPRLAEHGLAFTTLPTLSANRFVLRYLLLHTSGEYLDGEFPLPADSKTPQAMGSAITYARRYCLCAVTGVAPEDDDGAAATYSQQQRTVEPVDNERAAAIGAVQGAWQFQYGAWGDGSEAGAAYYKQTGKDVRDATPAELRQFAAYLSNLPKDEAGSDPAEPQRQADPAADLSEKQRGMIFALFENLGMKNDPAAQREYLGKLLERPIGSRRDVKAADAAVVIKSLEAAVAEARRTGVMPKTGEVEAEAGPRMIGRGDLRALSGLFKQLAIDDPVERLHVASSLVGHEPTDKATGKPSATGLTAAEGKTLLAVLADCKTRDDVEALIVKVEQERAEAGEP